MAFNSSYSLINLKDKERKNPDKKLHVFLILGVKWSRPSYCDPRVKNTKNKFNYKNCIKIFTLIIKNVKNCRLP